MQLFAEMNNRRSRHSAIEEGGVPECPITFLNGSSAASEQQLAVNRSDFINAKCGQQRNAIGANLARTPDETPKHLGRRHDAVHGRGEFDDAAGSAARGGDVQQKCEDRPRHIRTRAFSGTDTNGDASGNAKHENDAIGNIKRENRPAIGNRDVPNWQMRGRMAEAVGAWYDDHDDRHWKEDE